MRALHPLPAIAGVLISLAVGLLLAATVFAGLYLLGGHSWRGPYCSAVGEGATDYVPRKGERVIYVEDQWSGFPPGEHCRAYAVDQGEVSGAVSENQFLLSQAASLPRRVVLDSTRPGAGEYAWVLAAFLFPPALWGLYILTSTGRRQRLDFDTSPN